MITAQSLYVGTVGELVLKQHKTGMTLASVAMGKPLNLFPDLSSKMCFLFESQASVAESLE